MKKLTLKPNAFNKVEVLTRAQLRKVIGGVGNEDANLSGCTTDSECWYRGGSGSGPYTIWCNTSNGKCETWH